MSIRFGLVAAFFAVSAARAQLTCATPNCVFNGKPPACQLRAGPRTPTVNMGPGGGLVFDPANPKIEPGECITWRSASITHNSSASGCADDSLCGAPPVAGCTWDTGNISSGATPTATCAYDPATFPVGTGNAYYCRVHASPTVGTMRGTLRVTTPIVLSVDKDLGTSSVVLSWTGGGVTGDVTYKVARNSGGDPVMPAATTVTVNPDAGVAGTTFTDTGDLLNTTARYYLVRNRQTNEP